MPSATVVACPHCGHEVPIIKRPLRKARMVWSEKRQHFVRAMLTDLEWGAYHRKGSID